MLFPTTVDPKPQERGRGAFFSQRFYFTQVDEGKKNFFFRRHRRRTGTMAAVNLSFVHAECMIGSGCFVFFITRVTKKKKSRHVCAPPLTTLLGTFCGGLHPHYIGRSHLLGGRSFRFHLDTSLRQLEAAPSRAALHTATTRPTLAVPQKLPFREVQTRFAPWTFFLPFGGAGE